MPNVKRNAYFTRSKSIIKIQHKARHTGKIFQICYQYTMKNAVFQILKKYFRPEWNVFIILMRKEKAMKKIREGGGGKRCNTMME